MGNFTPPETHEALQVPCPVCQAPTNSPCRENGKTLTMVYHAERAVVSHRRSEAKARSVDLPDRVPAYQRVQMLPQRAPTIFPPSDVEPGLEPEEDETVSLEEALRRSFHVDYVEKLKTGKLIVRMWSGARFLVTTEELD